MDLKWTGPKIAQKAGKTFAIYNTKITQLDPEHLKLLRNQAEIDQYVDGLIPVEIKRISEKLPYSEFRRVRYKEVFELAQFIYPMNNKAQTLYQADQPDEKLGDLKEMSTRKILLYAHQKAQTALTNSTAMQSRQAREKQWKKWWEEEEKKQHHRSIKKNQFYQTQISSIVLTHKDKLFDFQSEHVQNLVTCLQTNGTALDASDTGTGKTYVALAIAKELDLIPIVVCPKSIISCWQRVMSHFGLVDYYVANYEKFRGGKTPYLIKSRDKNSQRPFEWQLDPQQHLLIFDECHKVKNIGTQNFLFYAQASHQAKQDGLKVLSLSATTCDQIENAYPIALMLGLVQNQVDFKKQYQKQLNPQILQNFGYEVTETGFFRFNEDYRDILTKLQSEDPNLLELYHQIFPYYGSRIKISELGDAFPDNFIEIQAYHMDKRAGQIQQVYVQMAEQILNLKLSQQTKLADEVNRLEHIANPTDSDLDKMLSAQRKWDEGEKRIKELRQEWNLTDLKNKSQSPNRSTTQTGQNQNQNQNQNYLSIIQQARQEIEKLKVETFLELALDFLDQGKSVVIFVNFVQTLELLVTALKKKKWTPSIVRGGQTTSERTAEIDLFQSNDNKVFVSTIQSGGVGLSLHDLDGGHPRVSLISPTWSAQDLLQALGRIYRAGGKSPCLQYVVFCAETIEEKICETVKEKVGNINTLNNGDLTLGMSF